VISMAQGSSGFDLSPSGSARIIRIGKRLYRELSSCPEFLGSVGQIYRTGFDLVLQDGRIIHVRGGAWLQSPFGAVIDQPGTQWIEAVSLREGDTFYREGNLLVCKTRIAFSICLDPLHIVDLKRTLYSSPPSDETVQFWIQVLTESIERWGRFDGVAGTLVLLRTELPHLCSKRLVPLSLWSRHALPRVKQLLQAVTEDDGDRFEEAWGSLVGIGPGLTPAGDDFLVGFLAVLTCFSSPFYKRLKSDNRIEALKEKARHKTVTIASQFLTSALDGVFSEILYLIFTSLITQRKNRGYAHSMCSAKENPMAIKCFLNWGHSSGTDTLAGVVLGFLCLLSAN